VCHRKYIDSSYLKCHVWSWRDPPRDDPPPYGSSSRGSSSQATYGTEWQSRLGQNVPAFPSNWIVSSRRIDPRVLKFGTSKVPRLTRMTLMNTEVHHLIQYIHQLLSHKAFDDSVLGNMIDMFFVQLRRRPDIINHWTVDWDVVWHYHNDGVHRDLSECRWCLVNICEWH
jgi:hypothetical protein